MQAVKTERKWVNKVWTVSCAECGREFTAKRSDASFCGATCRSRWARRPQQMQDDIYRVVATGDMVKRLVKQYGDHDGLIQAIKNLKSELEAIIETKS